MEKQIYITYFEDQQKLQIQFGKNEILIIPNFLKGTTDKNEVTKSTVLRKEEATHLLKKLANYIL